jgi:hypothetical protein
MAPPTHLLVLGAARGGTTLLATVLGAHPKIACLDEDLCGAFDLIVGGKIKGVKLCVPNHVELDRRWRPVFTPGLWFGASRKSLWMNRQPKSRQSIRDLIALGDTQCVVILRAPEAVIGSIGRRENRSLRVAAYRWTRSVAVADGLMETAGRPPIIVDFDRLVSAPGEVTRGLCAGLDLDETPAMLAAPALNTRYPEATFDPARAGTAGYDDLDLSSLVTQTTMSAYHRLIARSV